MLGSHKWSVGRYLWPAGQPLLTVFILCGIILLNKISVLDTCNDGLVCAAELLQLVLSQHVEWPLQIMWG